MKHPGGRARQLKEDGFTFDMGPSFYWMPDVFERYFTSLEKKFLIIIHCIVLILLTVFTGMMALQICLLILMN